MKVVEINCVFYDPYGQLVLRERVTVVGRRTGLPSYRQRERFPAGFRQHPGELEPATAGLVIAQIVFGWLGRHFCLSNCASTRMMLELGGDPS